MKIIAINGSHKKKGGANQLLIDSIFNGARSEGAECETVRLSTTKIKPCTSCDYCQNNSEYKCVFDEKDDFLGIYNKILDADIVIYSTPVYIFNVSGLMKIFLDRIYSRGKCNVMTITKSNLLFHDVERNILNKKFVSIIVSDNIERETTKSLIYYFKSIASFFDYSYAGSIVRNGSFMFRKNAKEIYRRHVNGILKNLEIAGKKLIKENVLPKSLERKINKNIIPMPGFILNIMKRSKIGREKLLNKI